MTKLNHTLMAIEEVEEALRVEARQRLDQMAIPRGSLGRLEELAQWIVAVTRKPWPSLEHKVIVTMAGDHGVVAEGVSAFPPEVTAQMVANFLKGDAAVNVLARLSGAKVFVVDMGVAQDLEHREGLWIRKIDYGTRNFAHGPAMSHEQAIRAVEVGMEVVEEIHGPHGLSILGTGDMGIGNTTPSSAIIAALTGLPPEEVVGRGTGITDEMLERKIQVVQQGLEVNRPNPQDPLDVLTKVGGYETGGLAGCILACAQKKIPILIDGFISTAAALLAYHLQPRARDYMMASHCSAEKGHRAALEALGLKPLLDMNMRLGEGTGSCLAFNLVEAGIRCLKEVASFEKARVSESFLKETGDKKQETGKAIS